MDEQTPQAWTAGSRRLHIFIHQDLVGTLHEDNDLWALPHWYKEA